MGSGADHRGQLQGGFGHGLGIGQPAAGPAGQVVKLCNLDGSRGQEAGQGHRALGPGQDHVGDDNDLIVTGHFHDPVALFFRVLKGGHGIDD